jgi:hypothetical protein
LINLACALKLVIENVELILIYVLTQSKCVEFVVVMAGDDQKLVIRKFRSGCEM